MKKINGTGSVFYNSNKGLWAAQYIEEENGKTKKKCIYGKTRDIVNEKLQKVMYEYRNEDYVEQNGIPLIQVLKDSREDKFAANLISESHYSRLEFVIREIENSDIGYMDITKIKTRDLQNYFNSLITRYSDSTIKKIWECIKQGFKLAINQKYIKDNPFDNLLKPKSKRETKVIEAMTTDEQKILSKYLLESKISDERYKNVILIELYTGARIGEVLALTPNDIDFDTQRIKINKTISVNMDGQLIVKKGAKTSTGNREILFPTFLIPSLSEQVNKHYVENPNNLLFTIDGKIIKPSNVNTVLKRIDKQLGLPTTISNHVLRHTFGTRCIESGMSAVVVQRLMGHKDISVTINTYTSVLAKFKDEELNKVAQYYVDNDFIALPSESIVPASNDYSNFDTALAEEFMKYYRDTLQKQYEELLKNNKTIPEETEKILLKIDKAIERYNKLKNKQ